MSVYSTTLETIIYDEFKDMGTSPEKRLLACVLQRALIDLLSARKKSLRMLEVELGDDAEAEKDERRSPYAYGVKRTRDVRPAGNRNGGNSTHRNPREVRNLIRWFKSDSTDPFTFKHILITLNINELEGRILRIVENDTISDHPGLSQSLITNIL